MVENPTATPGKTKQKGGRPTRAEATAKALAAIGVDPAAINPMSILAAIAADLSAPSSARVAACRVLLERRDQAAEPRRPGNGKAGPRPSKRTQAQRAADNAGSGTPWGSDLVWPDGRRSQ